MPDPEKLSITTLKGGGAIELVDEELGRVLENIVDPNTDAKAVRAITLTLRFKPDEDRERVSVRMNVQAKLAPPTPCATKIWVLHTKLGVVGVEDNPHQRGLFEETKTVEAETHDEPVEAAARFGKKEAR